jgi:uncharacterized membrane protein HdeD (DUF308 family)
MLRTLVRNWWAIALRGVFAILFGLMAFAWPGLTLEVLVLVYGAYAFVDGVFAVVGSFTRRGEGRFPWAVLVVGLAGVAAGVVVLAFPGLAAAALVYFIAAWAIVRGIFEIVTAIHLRREISNEWLLVLAGLTSVVFGVLVMIWPAAGLLALLWLIGSYAIVLGVLAIALALRLRARAERGAAAPGAAR